MSLINRENLIAEYDRVHVGPAGRARKLMEKAPEVEAVDVDYILSIADEAEKRGTPSGIFFGGMLKAVVNDWRRLNHSEEPNG